MGTVWWITYAIMALYAANVVWLAAHGNWWGMLYWLCALGITVCAMQAVLR